MNHQKKHFDQHRRFPQDFNWNVVLELFLWLVSTVVVTIIAIALIGALLSSCQKESSFTSKEKPVIESDHHLKPQGGYNLTKRVWTPELEMASRRGGNGKGKGSGKPPKDTTTQEPPTEPPTDTTGNEPPPPPTGQGVIYLDFDGHYMTGTAWNYAGPVTLRYSGMNEAEIQATIQRVQSDYAEFNVTVTADSTLYWSAPANKRMRVVLTESWEWYGRAGGVAYLGSFSWGDNTPCFVFPSLLGYGSKVVADAASHEAGHTLNLRHQGKCDGTQYNSDIAPDGKGYLMGYPYPHISGWQVGVTPQCVGQDDRAIISNTLKQ